MSVRIQTWFPYRLQIALNGREWLARQLARAGLGFEQRGNKILRVDDLEAMQKLLDQQLRTDWRSLLDSFVPLAFPTFSSTLGQGLSYTWTSGRVSGRAICCSKIGTSVADRGGRSAIWGLAPVPQSTSGNKGPSPRWRIGLTR